MDDEPSKEALELVKRIRALDFGEHTYSDAQAADEINSFAAAAVERERERAVLDYDAVLGERDKFIVSQGLFMDFVAQLPKDAPRRSMFVEARNAALEEAARLVDETQEAVRNTTDDDGGRYLNPRRYGNLIGLAYSAGIRALKTETPNG